MNTIQDSCIKICNSLLRGELSAIETYAQALRKFPDSPAALKLHEIRDEHIESARLLTENVSDMGGDPERDSGGWGVFAKAIQGAANLFGPNSAVESLLRGEEAGKSDYLDALQNEDVMVECKILIRDRLLPAVERHILTLQSLQDIA